MTDSAFHTSTTQPKSPIAQTKARLQSVMHSLNPQSDAEPAQPQQNYPSTASLCNTQPLFPNTSNTYSAADVKDFPQCTPQHLKIIHIGCGAAGILVAHKAERWLKDYELTIYEKNPVIGGTWYGKLLPNSNQESWSCRSLTADCCLGLAETRLPASLAQSSPSKPLSIQADPS